MGEETTNFIHVWLGLARSSRAPPGGPRWLFPCSPTLSSLFTLLTLVSHGTPSPLHCTLGADAEAVKYGVGGIVTSLWFSSCGSLVFRSLPETVGDMASQLCPSLSVASVLARCLQCRRKGVMLREGLAGTCSPWCGAACGFRAQTCRCPLFLLSFSRHTLRISHTCSLFSRSGL